MIEKNKRLDTNLVNILRMKPWISSGNLDFPSKFQ